MNSAEVASPVTLRAPTSVWIGRVMSGLVSLFLAWDAGIKLTRHPMAVEGMQALGFPEHALLSTGLLCAVCLVLYLVPRTARFGAVLWTGYLGGAIAIHLRADNPLFSHTLFPVYVAVFLWGGLALRDPQVLELLGWRRGTSRSGV